MQFFFIFSRKNYDYKKYCFALGNREYYVLKWQLLVIKMLSTNNLVKLKLIYGHNIYANRAIIMFKLKVMCN